MEDFINKYIGKEFRFLIYKRMFTPFEQQQAYMDEDEFESHYYSVGILSNVFDICGSDWLLEFKELTDDKPNGRTLFFKLSDIRLEQYDYKGDECDDEE